MQSSTLACTWDCKDLKKFTVNKLVNIVSWWTMWFLRKHYAQSIFFNILLACQYSTSVNKHPCTPIYCHHRPIPTAKVQFYSTSVKQPSSLPSPSALQRKGSVNSSVPNCKAPKSVPKTWLSLSRSRECGSSSSRRAGGFISHNSYSFLVHKRK